MIEIKQHSIWMVELGDQSCSKGHEQYGDRPFYVISSTDYNINSETPIGFFVSTSEKKSQNKFTLELEDKGSVNISQIRTLDKSRFKKCIDQIQSNELETEVLSKFINQIIYSGQFNDKDFKEALDRKNTTVKVENLKKNFGK